MREPVASTTASKLARSSATVTSRPTSTPQRISTPSAISCSTRRCTTAFSILKSGTPDGHALTGLRSWRLGHHPALLEGPVDDRVLDLLDRHRVAFFYLQNAR